MKNLKIAFATEVTYPNYCNRLKKSALKYFFNYDLIDKDVHYYISTNMVSEFDGYDDINNIHVYNVEDLRDDPLSAKYELLPKDPIGLYPSKYPWNLRRYIIQKAAEDGFNYIIYIDADNVFHTMETDKFYNELLAAYEPNIVATNQTIFKYENKKPDDVFQYHDIYIDHFKTNFGVDDHDTIDGPVQVFMGDTNEDIIRLTKYWTKLSLFGYEKPLGVGYENNKHGNLSFVIPMSNFKLKWKSFPFYPNHVFSDRY
jgi:hypothetical protein